MGRKVEKMGLDKKKDILVMIFLPGEEGLEKYILTFVFFSAQRVSIPIIF